MVRRSCHCFRGCVGWLRRHGAVGFYSAGSRPGRRSVDCRCRAVVVVPAAACNGPECLAAPITPHPPTPATAVPDAAMPVLLIAEASRLLEENKGAALLAALLAGATAGSLTRK